MVPTDEDIVTVRFANAFDVSGCKHLADANRSELGFLNRAIFDEAVERERLLVADAAGKAIVGFIRFNHRMKGDETAIYDICVSHSWRRRGVGRELITQLADMCRGVGRTAIVLRCPEGASANAFYARIGFGQFGIELGRRRRLVVWRLVVEDAPWNSSPPLH